MLGLFVTSPILIPVIILVWFQDFKNPFYIAKRVGKNFKEFNMIKLRSMVVNADSTGVDSTSSNDQRITKLGKVIRKFKLDELSQLWNVLVGDMSLVGPRPNVKNETNLYTSSEKKLLSVKPGITDFSSIIFSDEGDILANKEDPDLSYNQLIRPWKSRLGIIYIKKMNFMLDIKLILITIIAIFSKSFALKLVNITLKKLGIGDEILEIAKREKELYPHPPPGSSEIVKKRTL